MYNKGVEVKFRNAFYEVLICPSGIPELNGLEVTDKGLVVGAAVTLTELGKKLQELVDSLPGISDYPYTYLILNLDYDLVSLSHQNFFCSVRNAEVVCRTTNKKCFCELSFLLMECIVELFCVGFGRQRL